MQRLLQEAVEVSELVQRGRSSQVMDVHLTQQLHGHGPAGEVGGREAAGTQHPGQEDEQRGPVGGERGCGLVVRGDTEVSIELRKREEGHR